MANAINISADNVKQQIYKNRLPTVDIAVKMSQYLNTTVEYLVTGKETNPYAEENKILKEKLSSIQKLLNE